MRFKFYLNDIQFYDVADIEDVAIEWERGNKQKGFFLKFVQKVTLFGDAYAYLENYIEENNPCGFVEVKIERQEHDFEPFELFFTGYISLKRVRFANYKHTCEVDIEDNTISSQFADKRSTKVNLSDTLDASFQHTLVDKKRQLQYFFDETPGAVATLLTETDGADYAYGYRILDAYSHIVSWITSGALTFKSDFLSTTHKHVAWEINITGAGLGGALILDLTTEFGENITLDFGFNTFGIFEATFGEVVYNELRYYAIVTNSGSDYNVIIITNGAKAELNNVTYSGTGTMTYSVLQAYQEGWKNLYISTGYLLSNRGEDNPMYISFDDLTDIVANSVFDLSYAIREEAGEMVLRLEPMQYFLTSAIATDLGTVKVTESGYFNKRIAGALLLGAKDLPANSKGFSFYNMSCDDFIDRRTDVHTSNEDIISQIKMENDFGSDYFLIEADDLGGSFEKPTRYISPTKSNYNQTIRRRENLIRYHLYFLPDAISYQVKDKVITYNNWPVRTVTETTIADKIGNDLQYLKYNRFEALLSAEQYKLIDGSKLLKYRDSSKPDTFVYGYIDKGSDQIKSGITEFTLIVK